MEGSMVSSRNNSGRSEPAQQRSSIDHEEEEEEEASAEESTWTEILADFSDLRREEGRKEEEEEDMEISNSMRSGSMVSDAGSGPEWKVRNYGDNMLMNSMPKRLNFIKAKEMPYDESLEDTASSPVNSPKEKGRVIARRHDRDQAMMPATNIHGSAVVDRQEKNLGEMGYVLVPVAMIINFNNYY